MVEYNTNYQHSWLLVSSKIIIRKIPNPTQPLPFEKKRFWNPPKYLLVAQLFLHTFGHGLHKSETSQMFCKAIEPHPFHQLKSTLTIRFPLSSASPVSRISSSIIPPMRRTSRSIYPLYVDRRLAHIILLAWWRRSNESIAERSGNCSRSMWSSLLRFPTKFLHSYMYVGYS